MEEKGSDVNLAARLLNDARQDLFESVVVESNDSGRRNAPGAFASANCRAATTKHSLHLGAAVELYHSLGLP